MSTGIIGVPMPIDRLLGGVEPVLKDAAGDRRGGTRAAEAILTTDLAAWQKVQTVNLTSVFLCCKYALTHMVAQGSGSIINTASFVALMGAATSQISYSA